MLKWSQHEHPAVRRLSSEGSRPRLPWAMALPAFKKDPRPILPILENLKSDGSETVRRSVANNLNDISKDSPHIVLDVIKNWKNKTKETDWVIKHGSRTLLKGGHSEVLKIFGMSTIKGLSINNLIILTPKVKIGQDLEFTFELNNSNTTDTKVRLAYGIYFQKANGNLSRKVFYISERIFSGNSKEVFRQKRSFKLITTRIFHRGRHQLAVIVNGKEQQKHDFQLI